MSRQSNVWPCKPWSYETVPIRIRTILSPSNGGRKCHREKHQALAVKGERHPNYGMKSNPGCSRQDLNTGCSGERLTSYHGKKEQAVFIRAVVVTPVQGTLPWRCWHELTVLSFWYEQLLSLLLPLTGQWCSTIVPSSISAHCRCCAVQMWRTADVWALFTRSWPPMGHLDHYSLSQNWRC